MPSIQRYTLCTQPSPRYSCTSFGVIQVIYEKEDNSYFLRVIIDKNGIIDIEDCVKVTHIVDPLLDTVDYIKDSYILDVCSKEKGCE